jgi:thioesterase domain-containing protein
MDREHLSKGLQRYLLEQIPISKALGISVIEANLEEILIAVPLASNLNHHGTGFGGSVSAVAILSGWALVYARLVAEDQFPAIVIQHNEIRYLKPIEGAIAARARLASPERWTHFLQSLSRHGKARTVVAVAVEGPRGVSARVLGTYVALRTTNVSEQQQTSTNVSSVDRSRS